MANPANFSRNARLKVKWAERHIARLIADAASLPNDIYSITSGPANAALLNPDRFEVVYKPLEPISEYFGAIMGDAVNNLREALDYWLNGAVSAKIERTFKGHFPFAEKRDDLERARAYPPIERAFPELARFIGSKIEPCRDTNLHLWAVTSLCNGNKHNDFLPVTTLTRVSTRSVKTGKLDIFNNTIHVKANNRTTLFASYTPIQINDDFRATADVTFPEGAVFAGQPVIPTMANLSQATIKTLDTLDSFLGR